MLRVSLCLAVALAGQFAGDSVQAAGGAGGIAVVTVATPTDTEPAIAEIPGMKVEPAKPVARQVVVINRAGPQPAIAGVRETVDRNDNIERVLLLAPGGPIVLQATIFIDGQPFRVRREALVDEALKHADPDGDGKPTWDEAFANPRFIYGGYFRMGQNEQQRKATFARFDRNGDGVADRYEMRLVVAQFGGGAEFLATPDYSGVNQPDLLKLLDADGDGTISAEEIAAAPERLKSRDANDNDLLEFAELGAGGVGPYQRAALPNGRVRANPTLSVVSLGTGANFGQIMDALRNRYARDGKLTAASFPLFPRLFDAVDRNANGELDFEELAAFNTMRPHVAVTVRLGKVEGGKPGVEVTHLAGEFLERNALPPAAGDVALGMPGLKLRLRAAASVAQTYDYSQTANAMLAQIDVDKNGYAEKKELDGLANKDYYLAQFDRWDANGDGKVYADEIKADYERQQAPRLSQVYLSAGDQGPSLFAALDQSGDSRLSLREMRTAGERLKTLDKNGDGRLDPDEIPGEMRVSFGWGGFYGGQTAFVVGGGRVGAATGPAAPAAGPKWFVHMDKNGDGDVTLREFLGTPEQFRELDKNGDGFIEPAEAAASLER